MNEFHSAAAFFTFLVCLRLISVYSSFWSSWCNSFLWDDKNVFFLLFSAQEKDSNGVLGNESKNNPEMCASFVFIPLMVLQCLFQEMIWVFLDLSPCKWTECRRILYLSFSFPLTSFSLLPKIKPGPTLYAKTNTLLKYIVSCLHRRHEFPFQMVCVNTMTQAFSFGISCDWPVLFWGHLIG